MGIALIGIGVGFLIIGMGAMGNKQAQMDRKLNAIIKHLGMGREEEDSEADYNN